jgi:four helix bundle protein
MPMEKLVAYQVARELLQLVIAANITDSKLRDQAMRAAQSTCLNIAEAAGRWSKADRARVFHIARGECCEVTAALDISSLSKSCDAEVAKRGVLVGSRLYGLLTGLIRR